MRTWLLAILVATLANAGCGMQRSATEETQSLAPASATAVEHGVRAFMGAVAHDVTQNGPGAWRGYFENSPAFFMADEGKLVFPNSASASAAIDDLARNVKQIDLQWGSDLRVDPLTTDFAVVAASYHETRVSRAGERVDENGFFTGVAEYREGHWQFRDAHWSVAAPPPAVP
jgi:hypothetical protein